MNELGWIIAGGLVMSAIAMIGGVTCTGITPMAIQIRTTDPSALNLRLPI